MSTTEFYTTLTSFVEQLKDLFPENAPGLAEYQHVLGTLGSNDNHRQAILDEFLEQTRPHRQAIITKNFEFITAHSASIDALTKAELNKNWNDPEIDDEIREGIWNYIQTLLRLAMLVERENTMRAVQEGLQGANLPADMRSTIQNLANDPQTMNHLQELQSNPLIMSHLDQFQSANLGGLDLQKLFPGMNPDLMDRIMAQANSLLEEEGGINGVIMSGMMDPDGLMERVLDRDPGLADDIQGASNPAEIAQIASQLNQGGGGAATVASFFNGAQ